MEFKKIHNKSPNFSQCTEQGSKRQKDKMRKKIKRQKDNKKTRNEKDKK